MDLDRFKEISKNKSAENKKFLSGLKKKDPTLNDDEYWATRNTLIANGVLSKGRGKGGSVYRREIVLPQNKKEAIKKVRLAEKDLYAPFMKVVREFWTKDNDIDDYIIEDTSSQGKKKTGGRWTRPDVTLISIKNYQFVYGKIMDVLTFEIKPQDNYGVESVFETASQSVFANKSFLCIHLPAGKPETEDFDRIVRQCEQFGVGLIVFEKPEDWETYETVVDPKRKEPDPYEVNSFIKQQMKEESKESLSRKIK